MTSLKYRRGTAYKVSFPTVGSLTAQPYYVELRQVKGEHEILTLEFKRTSSLWFEVLKTGTPVAFTWDQNGKKGSWYGYVTVVSKQSASQMNRTFKIICVGTSFVLKAKSQVSFKDCTIAEAAEKIAKQFNFRFVGTPTTRKFTSLPLAGQSYWEWLQKQAARIGYVCTVRNGTMYFTTIDSLIDMFMPTSAVLTGEPPGPASDRKVFDRTLDSFTVLNSDYLDHDILPQRTARVVSGMNPVTGQVLSSSSAPNKHRKPLRSKETPTLFSTYSDEVVHSANAAKQAAYEQARAVTFSIVAEVIGQGDPFIHPYSTVAVEGTGVETDGYWVTASAIHQMYITGEYQVECRVLSDGLGKTVSTPVRRPDGNPHGTVNLTAATLNILKRGTSTAPTLKLVTKVPIQVESQQGFVELGSIWSGR